LKSEFGGNSMQWTRLCS